MRLSGRVGLGAATILTNMALFSTVAAAPRAPTTLYDFTAKTIDGEATSLSAYRGSPVQLVVNVASE